MLPESRFLCVRFIALGACVRSLGAVHISPVRIQHGLRVERLGALLAREGPFGVVRKGVSFKRRLLRKSLPALFATERFLLQVRMFVIV